MDEVNGQPVEGGNQVEDKERADALIRIMAGMDRENERLRGKIEELNKSKEVSIIDEIRRILENHKPPDDVPEERRAAWKELRKNIRRIK